MCCIDLILGEVSRMVRRTFAAFAFCIATTSLGFAQKPGFYPAAPGPVMSVPSEALFPEAPPAGVPSGYAERAPRYPIDENGNRAVNWFYSQTELLYGWANKTGSGQNLSTTGTTFSRGVLGETGTAGLGYPSDFGTANGVRQMIGVWLVPSRTLGFEIGGFALERRIDTNSHASNGTQVISRPFFDLTTGSENARIIAFPNAFTGRIDETSTQRTFGAEANFIVNFMERDSFSLDFVNGFRFMALQESLTIRDYSQAVGQGSIAFNGNFFSNPAAISVTDSVSTANRFYGYSLGLRGSGEYNRFSYAVTAKIGLGAVHQNQSARGSTSFFANGGSVLTERASNGMLFFASNSGHTSETKFAVLSEIGLKVGYRITHHISTYVGYDAMYLNETVRPGDTINRNINPNLLPSSPNFGIPFGSQAAPVRSTRTSDFLLHTFSSGVMVVF
jgi:hypothetical protein